MMNILTKISCCFNSLSTKCIEIIIIILSVIGMIFSIIGMAVIPWGFTSKSMEVFYLMSLIFFIYSLIICIFNFISHRKSIGENVKAFFQINSFIIVFICILCILLYIFIAITTIPDLKEHKTIENTTIIENNNEIKETIKTEEVLISDGRIAFSVLSIIINIILWILLLLLWAAEFIRLKFKIGTSYNNYLNVQRNVSIESSTRPEFNIIGHDKYGFPIYNEKMENKLQIEKSRTDFNFRTSSINNKIETETNNILKYSYKEKYKQYLSKPDYKSVDAIHKLRKDKNEKYIEKYIENGVTEGANPYYSNFENKTILNFSTGNNSINPGY